MYGQHRLLPVVNPLIPWVPGPIKTLTGPFGTGFSFGGFLAGFQQFPLASQSRI